MPNASSKSCYVVDFIHEMIDLSNKICAQEKALSVCPECKRIRNVYIVKKHGVHYVCDNKKCNRNGVVIK